jgi:hypothetical protein
VTKVIAVIGLDRRDVGWVDYDRYSSVIYQWSIVIAPASPAARRYVGSDRSGNGLPCSSAESPIRFQQIAGESNVHRANFGNS